MLFPPPLPALLAWCGMLAVAIANGALRDLTYGKHLSELRGHQISSFTGSAALFACIALYDARFPFPTLTSALAVGFLWLGLTIAFECGMGRARKLPWSALLRDYNLRAGRLWILILLTLALSPPLLFLARQ